MQCLTIWIKVITLQHIFLPLYACHCWILFCARITSWLEIIFFLPVHNTAVKCNVALIYANLFLIFFLTSILLSVWCGDATVTVCSKLGETLTPQKLFVPKGLIFWTPQWFLLRAVYMQTFMLNLLTRISYYSSNFHPKTVKKKIYIHRSQRTSQLKDY